MRVRKRDERRDRPYLFHCHVFWKLGKLGKAGSPRLDSRRKSLKSLSAVIASFRQTRTGDMVTDFYDGDDL